MKRFLAGFALAWFVAGIASFSEKVASQAQTDPAALAVLGAGWADCEEAIDALGNDESLRALFTSWIQGYITGRNEMGGPSGEPARADLPGAPLVAPPLKDIGANVSPAALFVAAETYCNENPLKKFSDASRSVYDQLVERAQSAP